jgi:amidohydrolase
MDFMDASLPQVTLEYVMRLKGVILILILSLLAVCMGQETPTERDAARDVVRKLDALEQSLDIPALVAKLTGPDAERDRVAARARELMESGMLSLADDITRHPEIGFQERRSIAKLIEVLRQHGFEVKTDAAGFETAFVGRFHGNHGKPVLGVILEYDALRGTKGPFHGDQHSAQGPVGIAAAIAVAEFLERTKTPGSVVVYGTPAEEMMPPPVKTVMFQAGVFDADIIVRSHSSTSSTRAAPGFGTCCLNIDGVKYIFSGAPAHQLAAWNGRNALTAVIELFNHIDALRSNIRPEARIQGIIAEGGTAPNVVPDRAVADFYIRYPDAAYLKQVREMVDNAARAAALATGTKVKIDAYGEMRDGISIASLGEVSFAYLKKYGATHLETVSGGPQGYDETGSVSSAVPGVGVSAFTSNGAYHTYEMEADALTETGHSGFVVDAQTMASILYDFAAYPDYRVAVKHEFDVIRSLFDEYQGALQKAYKIPAVPDPK